MYDDNYVEICESRYGFTRITGPIRDLALRGIDTLEISPEAPEWKVEAGVVLPEGGQGDYVISTRRRPLSSMEQERLSRDVAGNEEHLMTLYAKLQLLEAALLGAGGALDGGSSELDLQLLESDFGYDEQMQLSVAFILSILSISLWFVTFIFMCVLKAELAASTRALAAIAADTRRKHHKQSTVKSANDPDDISPSS
jgi:hypothetical protein